jgi:hypothetical protein
VPKGCTQYRRRKAHPSTSPVHYRMLTTNRTTSASTTMPTRARCHRRLRGETSAPKSPQSHWLGSFGSGGTGPTGVGINQVKVVAIQCVVRVPEMSRVPLTQRKAAVPEVTAPLWRYRAPITSCSCAVSTNCWKLVTLPSRSFQTWHTWASRFLLVSLCVPVYRTSTTTVSPAS